MPGNCSRLIFRQPFVRSCHPVHHCDSICPCTGNITNLPTGSLWRHHRIALSAIKAVLFFFFYSTSTLQAEIRKYATRRSKAGGTPGATSAADSFSSSCQDYVFVMAHWGSNIKTTDQVDFPRCAWDSSDSNSVFIQTVYITVRGGGPTSPLRKQ